MRAENMKEKINWIMATQTPCNGPTDPKPFFPSPRPHHIREKRYKLDTDSQAWSLLDVLKAVATFAVGSWIAWRVLDLLAGGGR